MMDRKKLPNNDIIKTLREIWFEKNGNRRNSDLAEILGINASALSAFCSSKEMSPPRRCPDWVIIKMLEILSIKITISDSEILIHDKNYFSNEQRLENA